MTTKQIKTPHRAAQTAIPTSYIRELIVQPENNQMSLEDYQGVFAI